MDINDLTRSGFPTMAEFMKNPDFYRKKYGKHDENLFDDLSNGQDNAYVRNHIQSATYQYRQWTCQTLEELQQVLKNEGQNIHQMKWIAEFDDFIAGKGNILVKVMTEFEYNLLYPNNLPQA